MSTEPHKRRWFQFRLRTLFILVAVLAVPLAWLAHERSKVRARLDWLKSLNTEGPTVVYEPTLHAQPGWLRFLLGDDSDADVIAFYINTKRAKIDFVHVAGFTQLRELDIFGRNFTDSELAQLNGLTTIRRLHLEGTQVTDAGLPHIVSLIKQPAFISLRDTPTTPAGRNKLRYELPGCMIAPEP